MEFMERPAQRSRKRVGQLRRSTRAVSKDHTLSAAR